MSSPLVSSPPSIISPVPDDTLAPPTDPPGSFVEALRADPQALVYMLLNVGDGDCQLILLPTDEGRPRQLAIVDIASRRKLPQLLKALHEAELIAAPGTPGQVRLLVASHPHHDHIGGMTELLDTYQKEGFIDQLWEPGYFYPSPSFHNLMRQLEGRTDIRWMQPTSGTSLFIGSVRFTVVGPGVGLKNRFDTYGVNVNDASITLMVEYPATKIQGEPDPKNKKRINRRLIKRKTRRLLLGADAQFTSWAQATVDFPNLEQEYNPVLARELRSATGGDYLKADLMKLSHHGSKHGVNIELLERVAAPTVLVSSQSGGGKYNFPHLLAMEAVREARQPSTTSSAERQPDYALGVHVTGAKLESGDEMGSIAAVVGSSATAPIRLFRLFDTPEADIELHKAREARNLARSKRRGAATARK
ncbi:MAG TPA: MBL fold metallo-hydrolase [Propionibacteriaceae bacterium]|nr:MBL fold metallo-hydrolase [Propionibacteriaceae bacterium]